MGTRRICCLFFLPQAPFSKLTALQFHPSSLNEHLRRKSPTTVGFLTPIACARKITRCARRQARRHLQSNTLLFGTKSGGIPIDNSKFFSTYGTRNRWAKSQWSIF